MEIEKEESFGFSVATEQQKPNFYALPCQQLYHLYIEIYISSPPAVDDEQPDSDGHAAAQPQHDISHHINFEKIEDRRHRILGERHCRLKIELIWMNELR